MCGKTIVVADDRCGRLENVAASLRQAGFDVVSTRDAEQVSQIAEQGNADLLITNYTLNESSGVELCQQLRTNARTARLPAILVTAKGYCVADSVAEKAGIRRIVPGSIRGSEMVASVSDVLKRRAA